MPPLPKAVLFDLDGTLVDSAPDIRSALNAVLAENGRRPVDLAETKRMIGDSTAKLVERAFAATGAVPERDQMAARQARYLEIYDRVLADTSRPFPGVPEVLHDLRADGLRMAVCTNKFVEPTHRLLAALDLADFFEVVIGGNSLAVRKPDPGHLLGALEALGTGTRSAAMVGDNEHDVAAAHRAGLPAVIMAYGYARVPVAELGADTVLSDFHALPAALRALPV